MEAGSNEALLALPQSLTQVAAPHDPGKTEERTMFCSTINGPVNFSAAVITVSVPARAGQRVDASGPAVAALLGNPLSRGAKQIVQDDSMRSECAGAPWRWKFASL